MCWSAPQLDSAHRRRLRKKDVNRCSICRPVSCTVQHPLMIRKLMDMTGDIDLCQVIRGLLNNRRFFVQLNDKKSRWRSQKNGLPRGSVLAPLTVQHLYKRSTSAYGLQQVHIYMLMTSVSPPNRVIFNKLNPAKTQICCFHLSTGLHPETPFLTQQKHLTPQNKMLVPHCG